MSDMRTQRWLPRPRTSTSRLTRRREGSRYDDSGMGMLEVVISMVLLITIMLPTTYLILATRNSANNSRLQVEADDLASQYLEQQVQAANSPSFGVNLQTVTRTLNGTVFTITGTIAYQNLANGVTPCQAPAGSGQSQQILVVSAKVVWRGQYSSTNSGQTGGPVALSTYIAPAAVGTQSNNLGELAVPIQTFDATPLTTIPVWFTVQGVWEGVGSAPSVVSGAVINETESTGNDGCAIFPNLDPTAGWVYTVEAAYCGVNGAVTNCTAQSYNVVDVAENSAPISTNPASPGIPTSTGWTTTAGGITIVQPFIVQSAAVVPISFKTYLYPSGGAAPTLETPSWTPSNVEVTVADSLVPCVTSPLPAHCVLGNGTTAVATASGTTTNLQLYPYPDGYTLWAGDELESNPGASSTASPPVPYYYTGSYTQPDTTTPPLPPETASLIATTEPAQTIPLFYANVTVSCAHISAGQTVTGITFTEVDGAGLAYADSPATPPSCTKTTSANYTVGLPLGEYELGVAGTGSPVISATYGATFLWVTPFGTCTATADIPTSVTSAITSTCGGLGTWSSTAAVGIGVT